ncbi:RDD family protein [Streptomyces goshikiensis]|uniref:RDD family protein n=1 Tax=Streptomyces goshikiensis TaxID=1942 RepID=UPI0022F3E693|nr:RDD family protein [Streptomyces goshikiensis]WBY20387.1 RDD family protein [Streptomyces goshikiensis]WSX99794.1 RDD family protein [Streptomyces goshikiensis]
MTASPGDGEHAAREGYYPDPSIPGYVRYWNGLSWVPGTSRPAPPVDETGPVFLDETSATEALPEPSPARSPVPLPVPSPEPDPASEPVMWQADPAHQHGFGGPRDARVSWGSREEPPGPVRGAGVSLARTAAASPAASPTPGSAPAPDPAPGPAPDRSPEAAAAPASVPAPVPAPARPSEAAPAPAAARAAAPAPEWPDAGDGGRAGSGLTSSWPEATPKSRPAPAPTRVQPDPQAYAQAQAQAHVRAASPLPGQSSAPAPAAADAPLPAQDPAQAPQPRAAARVDGPRPGRAPARADAPLPGQGAAPAQASAPIPGQAAAPAQGQARAAAGAGAGAGAGERGDDAGRRQTATASEGARRAESGAAAAGQRPDARAVFERMAERAVRPSGLVRRGLARAVDSLVFAAVAAAAARPLVPAATAHIEAKVDAARGTGRTTTVWLLDATIGGYLGIVLAAVLLFGVFYEALPTARWGRTPGKKLFGVRVLATATLRPPGFGAALRRWLAYALFGLLGGLWCLGDRPRRRGLHDRAAGTYVAR